MPYAFTTEEIDYVRHGDVPQRAKLYRPTGDGPFPVVLDLHGGAWSNGDLADCDARDQVLAASGLFVAAINFRHAGDGYPTSLADINYAVRWFKANAARFNINPGAVGLSGTSSGGHLAMLAAMRPSDPRYAAIALPAGSPAVDATVQAIVMQWPVINPLSRYRHARRLRDTPTPPAWIGNIPERHELYWKSEAAMAEGNPVLILEKGEKVLTPPTLWIQGQPDQTHDYRDPESPVELNEPLRFAHDYRQAGGYIETLYVDNATKASAVSHNPTAAFFHRYLK
jgi:acetyl esterase/lipase